MRIALVTEFFYPTTGGTQTVVAQLASALGTRGHQVGVYAPHLVSSTQLPQPAHPYTTTWVRFRPWTFLGYCLAQRAIGAHLGQFDVVHLFHPAFGLGALLVVRRSSARFIVTLMGYDTANFASLPWPKQKIVLAVCRQADVVTAPSRDLAFLARQTGVTRAIEVLPHGVTPASPAPDRVAVLRRALGIRTGQIVYVAVQRHSPIKQPEVFLQAWRSLARPDCRLILVGGGEREPLLRRRLADLGLTNVTMTGEVPAADVPAYLALADAFIHHSCYESFGLGVLEAMQAGLPVIACHVGGVPEIITSGVDGLLIPPSDAAAMAAAVHQLARSPALRGRLAQAARRRAAAFSWDPLIERYETLYAG